MKQKFLILTICALLNMINIQAQIVPSKNKIAVDVSTYHVQNPIYNYDSSFAIGSDLGMTEVGLFVNWTMLETSPNVFDFTVLNIANTYYPSKGIAVDLNLNPINTNRLEVPSDLASMAFDNPVFINRYKTLLDSVKKHTSNITFSSLVIGSEFDAYLGTDAVKWKQYTTFYDSASVYAKKIWTGLKVAAELQFPGLINQNALAQKLNTNSDYIGVSYYPLFADFTVKPVYTVPFDMDTLIDLYPSKPICFYQYGYPSSTVCKSSDSLQAQFIAQTFLYWDFFAAHIRLIDFTWITDLDVAAVNYYSTYYGLSDPVFLEFLRSIGLRKWNGNGTDKLALNELRCQAKQRGYNSLPIVCPLTGVNDNTNSGNDIRIYPNPASEALNISFGNYQKQSIQIFNSTGNLVKEIKNLQSAQINIADLPSGFYFVRVKDDLQQPCKFIKE